MELILYHTDDNPMVINKKLSQVRTVNVILRSTLDEKSPALLLHDDTIAGANYCYIPAFNRYYFIDQVVRFNAHLVKVILNTDLLMTYKDELLSKEVLITATSKPSYLSSGLPTTEQIETDRYTSDFTLPDGTTTILTTIGG